MNLLGLGYFLNILHIKTDDLCSDNFKLCFSSKQFHDVHCSHMPEMRFLQQLDIYHCKTVKLFQMYEWPEFMWTCLSAYVCVPDAWKACCVVNSTSLKHWAASQQLVCDSFYWNYLFLITIESKFNLFHKLIVLKSFFAGGKCLLLAQGSLTPCSFEKIGLK